MNDFDELIQMSGQYSILTIQRPYITYTGSPEGGLLISQMIYWARRTNDPDGWFYKSYADWEEEICVKRKSVTKFSLRWIEEGFLETKVKKNPHGVPVLHYRFSVQIFKIKYREFLDMSQETDGHSRNRKASRSSKSACPERQVGMSPETKDCTKSNKSTLYTSTTSINSSTNTSPERGREENHELSSSRAIGLSVPEDFGGRSLFVVQQPKDVSLTQDDRREDRIFAAPKISPEATERAEKLAGNADDCIDAVGHSLGSSRGDFTGLSRPTSICWPPGPWLSVGGGINKKLVRWIADSWRSGSSPKAKDFAAQQLEQVEACVKRYWAKNFVNLALDWDAYTANSERLAQSTELRVSGGVEIPLLEQEAIVSRLQSAGIIPGSRVVPVGNLRSFSEPFLLTLSVEEQQQQKLAINAARSKFFSAPVNSLMEAC